MSDTDHFGVNDVIVRNSARCLACNDEIESTHRHDFVTCSCGAIFVDGGTAYLRRGWDERSKGMVDTSIMAPEESRTHTLEHTDTQLHGVHHSARCEGRPCPIHRRMPGHMRSWPQVWQQGRVMRANPFGGWCADPDDPFHGDCISCAIFPFTGRPVCEPFELDGTPAALLWQYLGYAVTEDGRVWSFKKRKGPQRGEDDWSHAPVLKWSSDPATSKQSGRYLIITLVERDGSVTSRKPHELVLLGFRGERPEGMVCRHLDGNTRNNALSNLLWGSSAENSADMIAHGTGRTPRGTDHIRATFSEEEVLEMRVLWRSGEWSQRGLARRYGASSSAIRGAVTGTTWKHLDEIEKPCRCDRGKLKTTGRYRACAGDCLNDKDGA